jgi:hypothetical protein
MGAAQRALGAHPRSRPSDAPRLTRQRRFSLINFGRDAFGSFEQVLVAKRSTSARRSSVASRLLTTLSGRSLSGVAADGCHDPNEGAQFGDVIQHPSILPIGEE